MSKNAKKVNRTLLYVLGVVIVVVMVFPIFWLVGMSFKTELGIYEIPPNFFPMPRLDNYIEAFKMRPLGKYLLNSTIVTIISTIVSV